MRFSCNHCCRKKINIKYRKRVFVALVIQHGILMRSMILSSVAYPAGPYLSTLTHKEQTV